MPEDRHRSEHGVHRTEGHLEQRPAVPPDRERRRRDRRGVGLSGRFATTHGGEGTGQVAGALASVVDVHASDRSGFRGRGPRDQRPPLRRLL
ncbi:hypothetical protein PLANTIT3_100056 [Plantibacter sp. T3]|nr:hypothetical protein PLANTIT3_100056 [Plantibacter sp. T3]